MQNLRGGDGIGATNWGNYVNSSFKVQDINAKYSTNDTKLWNATLAYTKPSSKVFLTTGASMGRNSRMNIADLAGNVCEWTLEFSGSSTNPSVNRGGYCGDQGASNAPIISWPNATNNVMSNNGFRVTLYK